MKPSNNRFKKPSHNLHNSVYASCAAEVNRPEVSTMYGVKSEIVTERPEKLTVHKLGTEKRGHEILLWKDV